MITPFAVAAGANGAGTIAYQALRLSGQISAGSNASAELLADALFECNTMIDSWNAQQLSQYFYDDRYFNITTSQQSYTLGPTGLLNIDSSGNPLTYRPQRIIRANLVLLTNVSTPTRIPIEIIPVTDFADIPVIAIPSQVTIKMYVQTTKDNVTLWCFPFPTVGNQFEFFMWPGIPQFASLTATFDGVSGYTDWMIYSLAERLYLLNTKDVGRAAANRLAMIRTKRIEAERVIAGSNAPTIVLNPDLVTETGNALGAPFNYLTGDWSQ